MDTGGRNVNLLNGVVRVREDVEEVEEGGVGYRW